MGIKKETRQSLRLILRNIFAELPKGLSRALSRTVEHFVILHLLGLRAIAVVGLILVMLSVFDLIFNGIATAARGRVARGLGAGEYQKIWQTANQSILLVVYGGVLLGLIPLFLAEPLLQLFGASPEMITIGATYFRLLGGLYWIHALFMLLEEILGGAQETRWTPKVSLGVSIFSIAVSFLLVWMGLGLLGVGLGFVLSRAIGLLLLLLLFRSNEGIGKGVFRWIPRVSDQWKILKDSFPEMLVFASTSASVIFYAPWILSLGEEKYAVYNTVDKVASWFGQVLSASSKTANALVGEEFGYQKKNNVQDNRAILGLITRILLVGLSFTLFLVMMGSVVLGLFQAQIFSTVLGTDAKALQELAYLLFVITMARWIVFSGAFVAMGAIRGVGRNPAIVFYNMIYQLIMMVGVGYAVHGAESIVGVQLTSLVASVWGTLFLGYYVYSVRWRQPRFSWSHTWRRLLLPIARPFHNRQQPG